MNVVIGNSGTVAPVWAARVIGRFSRTNRRSADTTAWMVMFECPLLVPGPGSGVFCGTNTICPFTDSTCTLVTKNCGVVDRSGSPSGR